MTRWILVVGALALLAVSALAMEQAKDMRILAANLNRVTEDLAALREDHEALVAELEAVHNREQVLRVQVDQLERELQDLRAMIPGTGQRVAYLSFDDGPSHLTDQILDILATHGVRATFFVNGRETPEALARYRRIIDEGHVLANHVYFHEYSRIYRSVDAFMGYVVQLQDLLEGTTGVRPRLFRFPGGSTTPLAARFAGYDIMPDLIEVLGQKGMTYVDWNASGDDAVAPLPDAEQIVRNVLDRTGGVRQLIVLLHDGGREDPAVVEALPELIAGLRAQGYVFRVLTPEGFTVRFPRS